MSAPADVILKLAGSITVRAYRPSDASTLASEADNPKVSQNMTDMFPSPYTLESAQYWIKFSSDKANFLPCALPPSTQSDNDPITDSLPSDYAVCIDDVVIGAVGLVYNPKLPRIITMGYWLGEAHWGKGIATIVATAFSDWVFDTFKWIVRIDGDAYSWNKGSQRVLVKAGFVYEGTQKWKAFKNGKFGDLLLFGKTKPNVKLEEFVTNAP